MVCCQEWRERVPGTSSAPRAATSVPVNRSWRARGRETALPDANDNYP
ncbi:MAG: hypothetical protein LBF09_01385 [Odoribacteraceae bacterium]|nr:hypothetical protein [Odoribacteraceae bacterium]